MASDKKRSVRAKRMRRQNKACQRGQKKKYASEQECEDLLVALAQRKGIAVEEINSSIYQCAACEYWHIARGKGDNYAMEAGHE